MRHYIPHRKNNKSFLKTVSILFVLFLIGIFFWHNGKKDEVSGKNTVDTKVVENDSNKEDLREKPYISIIPDRVVQGEPALIVVEGATTTESVKSFTFNDRPLNIFLHEGKVSAVIGIDLRATAGVYPLVLTFKDGKQLKEDFVISQRDLVQRPFDIPDKLGGNTPQGEKDLIASLAEEGRIINSLPVVHEKLWTEKFRSPLDIPLVIADEYGYTRSVGTYTTMPHKGTDIEADTGTPVFAMNRGIVKYVGNLRNYGNVVVVDHGAGVQTVYMHLSEILVSLDQMVEKGHLIAKSGDTGYTLGPHLHLTVRIWDISIDAMKFLQIFGEN